MIGALIIGLKVEQPAVFGLKVLYPPHFVRSACETEESRETDD
jgi:hypothetical protein